MWYMSSQQGSSPRERLLAAAAEHVAEHGIADQSLRSLAEALGTSHRMLIHHFGSKEGLLVELIKVVEDQQRAALAELHDASGDVLAAGEAFWARLRDPALRNQERLFFEVYGQALQGRAWAVPLLEGIVDDWLGPVRALLEEAGVDPADATAHARLSLAVTRGLLLDLLATGDEDGVRAAMDRFTALTLQTGRTASSDAR